MLVFVNEAFSVGSSSIYLLHALLEFVGHKATAMSTWPSVLHATCVDIKLLIVINMTVSYCVNDIML